MKKSIIAVAICAICSGAVNASVPSVTYTPDYQMTTAPVTGSDLIQDAALSNTLDTINQNFSDLSTQGSDEADMRVTEDSALSNRITTNGNNISANANAITTHDSVINDLSNRVTLDEQYDGTAISQNRQDIATNAQAITTKVDQAAFDAGQIKQDQSHAALVQRVTLDEQYDGAAISQNRQDIATNAQAITTKVDQSTFDSGIAAQGQAHAALAQRVTVDEQSDAAAIATNAQAITTKVDQSTFDSGMAAQGQAHAALAQRVVLDEQSDAAAISQNRQNISSNTSAIQTNTATITATNKRVDANQSEITTNRQEIGKTNTRVSRNESAIANHESRIGTLEANNGYGNRFNDLKNDVEKNRKNASRGIAGASALAGLPQLNQDQTFGVAAATGGYDGETAVAVGFSAHPIESNHNLIVKAGVTSATGGDIGWNAGVGYGW